MRVGIAADHAGYELKTEMVEHLRRAGHEVTDFGAAQKSEGDDYPDYVFPLAEAVAEGRVERGIAICGSGVGACIAANRVYGVRAALIEEVFAAHQGVEDDDMNLMCLGGRVVGPALAWDLIQSFLAAGFAEVERHRRRLNKIRAFETRRRGAQSKSPRAPLEGTVPISGK